MTEEDFLLLRKIIDAKINNDEDNLYSLQINFINKPCFLDVLKNMIILIYLQLPIKTEKITLKKGTKLYRVRRRNGIINANDPIEREPNPLKTKNRLNDEGEMALYLSSSKRLCLIELGIKFNEEYCVGEYDVLEDIHLGTFDEIKSKDDFLPFRKLSKVLMAVSKTDENEEKLNYISDAFKDTSIDKVIESGKDMIAPFIIASMLKEGDAHIYSRVISKNFKNNTYDGIRYSSSFLPLGDPLFTVSDYNYVLYSSGIKKLKFNYAVEEKSDRNYTFDEVFQIIISSGILNK